MTLTSRWIALGSLVGLGILIGAAAQEPVPAAARRAETPPAALKVGVVDLKKCFDSTRYDRINDEEERFKASFEELRKELDDINKKVDMAERNLKNSEDLPKLYADTARELGLLKYEAKMTAEFNREKSLAKYQEIQTDIYNGIRIVVNDYARKNGFDLVLKIDEPKQDATGGTPAYRRLSEPVLFHQETLDITDQIIDELNRIYRENKNR